MTTKRSNTASWVDEHYSKRLARHAVKTLDADRDDNTAMMQLAAMRKSVLYLREERMRIGPGFTMGTRVWHLDTPIPQAEIDKFAPGRRTLGGLGANTRAPRASRPCSHPALVSCFATRSTSAITRSRFPLHNFAISCSL